MASPLDLDLTTSDGVLQYLSNTPFASCSATKLTGGTANFAYRVHLNTPYEGRNTLVVKFGRAFLEIDGQRMPFDIERQKFEAEALKAVRDWTRPGSLVTVPAVHLFDSKNHVLIMDDCGENSVTLKDLLRDHNLRSHIAQKIGRALGEFLADVHSIGEKQPPDFMNLFASNEQARSISAWATYGRVRETLDGSAGLAALANPPLDLAKERLEQACTVADSMVQRLKLTEDKFVMGDFWPGNVLITMDGEDIRSIKVVDWELAKTGLPELDVGQFLAELQLLCRFHPDSQDATTAAARAFADAYGEKHAFNRHTVLTHFGAHLIAWTPRVPWGDKDATRKAVMDGIGMMCDKGDGDVVDYFLPTKLFLPEHLSYPVRIVSLDADVGPVKRGDRLLTYSFAHLPANPPPDALPETRFGTWDCAVDGDLASWNVKPGDVLSRPKARNHPAVLVTEECTHGEQIAGMCALCGKDMTNVDYLGVADTSRASIQMTHSRNGPTVSREIAERIEKEANDALLKARRLKLIVDLDQTIVHATVDPTVGEWIAEGEAWEAKRARLEQKAADRAAAEEGGEALDGSDAEEELEECNPNWEALKDVKKFRLGPELLAPPNMRGNGRHIALDDGCMYYIKPRPGWQEFMDNMSAKYEMHVYTMGTRAYALAVCKVLDPDGRLFGERILSRDESGSLTQKSLDRLFPTDQSMVVIIDDRADVWSGGMQFWCPNLIKVNPYDFFVGIGDINSSFMPKIPPLLPQITPPGKPPRDKPPIPTPGKMEDNMQNTDVELRAQTLEAQMEERPLAKQQSDLEAKSKEDEAKDTDGPISGDEPSTPSKSTEKHPAKALLNNDDTELIRVGKLLDEVHARFFTEYDARLPLSPKKRKLGSQEPERHNVPYDVKRIIPSIRASVFQGCHICFSSIIPLDVRPEAHEAWRLGQMFGARCHASLSPEVTHVVTGNPGTVKVQEAIRRGNIHVVDGLWFKNSVDAWQRQPEEAYSVKRPSQPATPAPDATAGAADDALKSDDEILVEEEENKLELDGVDWDDIDAEIAQELGDDDDLDDDEDDEEFSDETNSEIGSANSSPTRGQKRSRSVTPSEVGPDGPRSSPLSKRKKLTADRSPLKEGISAEDLPVAKAPAKAKAGSRSSTPVRRVNGSRASTPRARGSRPSSVAGDTESVMDSEDDGGSQAAEVDDDFLHSFEDELGEDLG
ncbi:hypothetical protein HDZ31DRAFT_28711 [Schizophyllum fasciatum]